MKLGVVNISNKTNKEYLIISTTTLKHFRLTYIAILFIYFISEDFFLREMVRLFAKTSSIPRMVYFYLIFTFFNLLMDYFANTLNRNWITITQKMGVKKYISQVVSNIQMKHVFAAIVFPSIAYISYVFLSVIYWHSFEELIFKATSKPFWLFIINICKTCFFFVSTIGLFSLVKHCVKQFVAQVEDSVDRLAIIISIIAIILTIVQIFK